MILHLASFDKPIGTLRGFRYERKTQSSHDLLSTYSNVLRPTVLRSLSKDWNRYKPKANTANKVPYFLEKLYNSAVYAN